MYKTGHDLSDAEIAARYSRIVKQVSMPRYFYGFVADLVGRAPQGHRVLDVGCGNGYLLEAIAERRPDLALWGVEPSAGLAASASKRAAGRWSVSSGRATDLPFGSASFDLVTMTEVFEHMKDPIAALREIARVLAGDGQLLLTTPNMSAYAPFWRVAERLPLGPLREPLLPWEHPLKTFQPIDTAYQFEEVEAIVRGAGFVIDGVGAREFFPYVTTAIPIARRVYAKFAQRPFDDMLARVLPPRLGYRLLLQCHPR